MYYIYIYIYIHTYIHSQAHREFHGESESANLGRDNLGREIGRSPDTTLEG